MPLEEIDIASSVLNHSIVAFSDRYLNARRPCIEKEVIWHGKER